MSINEFHDGTNVLIAGDNFASKNDPTWLGLDSRRHL